MADWKIGAFYLAYAGDVAYGRALSAVGRIDEALNWLREGISWFEQVGNRRAACMAALELARILIDSADTARPTGLALGPRLRSLFSHASDPCEEARNCLDRVLSSGAALAMQSARVEAMLLQARLCERDNDLAAARAALSEARIFAAPLGWLPLEQQINGEIRRLDSIPGQ